MSDTETYRSAVLMCAMAGNALAQHDLPKLLEAIEHAHAIGPILDPTLYRDKMPAMEQDKELLLAALPLWRWIKSRQPVTPESDGGES